MSATTLYLACGHPVEPLMDMVAAEVAEVEHGRPDPICPTCRAELAALRASWIGVREVADRPIVVPAGLTHQILGSLRGLRGRARGEPVVISGDRGETRLSERALLVLLRRLATDYAETRRDIRVGQVSADEYGLHVELQVRYRADIAVLTRQLRDWLRGRLGEQAGAELPALHLHVTDLHQ